MEVNRRSFFGVLCGVAASGKSIALKAEEAFRAAKVQGAFSNAMAKGMIDGTGEKSQSVSLSSKFTKDYFTKKLLKLNGKKSSRKNFYTLNSKRKIEIEELKSVSYSQKYRMLMKYEEQLEKEKQKFDILQNIKNLTEGREYWDDGED